jgi:hypothetical protein
MPPYFRTLRLVGYASFEFLVFVIPLVSPSAIAGCAFASNSEVGLDCADFLTDVKQNPRLNANVGSSPATQSFWISDFEA